MTRLKSHAILDVKISSVTVAELYCGVAKSKRKKVNEEALIKFLSPFDFVPFTDEDALMYGTIRAELERKGQVLGPYDLQLAAQSLARNLIMVTNNEKEFQRVKGLSIENWTK
jgi:tRNA(fMet)-specific endonuclease VapC